MWAEGPPAGSSWHARCVSRKLATDSNIFAGKDGSQILSNCPFLFMLCKLLSKCFHKILETFFDESKKSMSAAKESSFYLPVCLFVCFGGFIYFFKVISTFGSSFCSLKTDLNRKSDQEMEDETFRLSFVQPPLFMCKPCRTSCVNIYACSKWRVT